MKIQSLQNISFEQIFESFQAAFADYEVQVNADEFQTMIHRRGFKPSLSFGAFEGDKIVSFTLNGVGHHNKKLSAYDTGTGTIKAFRGQGLATEIFKYSVPYLKEAHIHQYVLEVLQHNTKAVDIYKKIGFEVQREFYYFVAESSQITPHNKALPDACTIEETSIAACKRMKDFCDFSPSWQNKFEAIERNPADFLAFGAFYKQQLVGYSIFEPQSGDVTQLTVAKAHRRKGLGSALLNKALQNHQKEIKVVNTALTCESMTAFLASFGIAPKGKQYEMKLKL